MLKESIQRIRFFFRAVTRRKLDILDLLERDHIRVEMLFLRWRLTRTKTQRERVFEAIKRELLSHAQLEERLFYPACAEIPDIKYFINESYDEHKHFKALLRELSRLPLDGEKADDKMKVLISEVERHVTEEENDLFPRVKAFMKESQLQRLGTDFGEAKQKRPPKLAA